ncbi:cation diffusion facilitator family transporter [Microcoleus sp. LEGE 07076]|uniref:cation diffusion facilitator family transporter n=1 Tax=Microcoleus sp. LEGE 07076 TaxID=915322 RepID=UPI001D15D7A8|nr:cation diffusion facilitator family transporter [Microcoleus sp. LEGE 07076]
MTFPVGDNFNFKNTKDLAQCDNANPRIAKVRLLQTALVLLSSFFVAELIAATNSHSLSLLADAGHVLSDVAALAVTLAATWYSSVKRSKSVGSAIELSLDTITIVKHRQDACFTNSKFSGGAGIFPARKRLVENGTISAIARSPIPDRPEIIAALVNSISLVAIALWIAVESIDRLQSPTPEVEGLPMLITAIVGLSINSINACCLHSCCHGDLNLKSAFLHAIADIFSSVGVIVAAIAVAWLHWNWADGLISLLVSASIILLTLPLLIESIQLLLGKVSAISAIQQPCDCQKISAEKLLFPSLKELI